MTRFGVQNSVIGWDDPFSDGKSAYRRTGERQDFPSQDPKPTAESFLNAIKALGVDFYMHMASPCEKETVDAVSRIAEYGLDFILGNEFGNINGPYAKGTNRCDIDIKTVKKAADTGKLLGLLYDESEHLQLHPCQYQNDAGKYQWSGVDGLTNAEISKNISDAVRARVNEANTDIYSEHVFPTLYHTFAAGGMNPCPKMLKEEYQSVQLSFAMGAAKQYGRKMGICVDLWGFDVGDWFTRIWGFPAHSPNEFYNALKAGFYTAPHMMFVENCDPLMRNTENGFLLSEFGELYKRFIAEHKKIRLPYGHADAICDIAVVHADNGVFSRFGTFGGNGAFGRKGKLQKSECDIFDIMHLLSHETVSKNGTTFWNTEFTAFETSKYPRTPENLSRLPLKSGCDKEHESSHHKLFYPLNNVLVFDEKAELKDFHTAKLLIAGGDRLSEKTAYDIQKFADGGGKALVRRGLMKPSKSIIETDSFTSDTAKELIAKFRGSASEWNIKFAEKQLKIINPSGDGNTLEEILI